MRRADFRASRRRAVHNEINTPLHRKLLALLRNYGGCRDDIWDMTC